MIAVGMGFVGAGIIMWAVLRRSYWPRDHVPRRYSGIWKRYGDRWTEQGVRLSIAVRLVAGAALVVTGVVLGA